MNFSKLGASYAQIEETIDLIASNESDQYSTHPSYDKRIAAVKKGFDRAYSSSSNSSSNSSSGNRNTVVNSNSKPSDIVPNFENPRSVTRYRYGNWLKENSYRLEQFVKTFKAKDDPFELERLKKDTPIRTALAQSYGRSLSPLGSKNPKLEISTSHYTYNYTTLSNGNKFIYHTPNKFYGIAFTGFYETPKEIIYDFEKYGPNIDVYVTFEYIIDGEFSGSLIGKFSGWYESDMLYTKEGTKFLDERIKQPFSIDLNGYYNSHMQKENYEFIQRLKAGKKLYLRVGKLFIWNGYLNVKDGAWDTSRINNNYDVPRYTYEFDLTGSSKALSF